MTLPGLRLAAALFAVAQVMPSNTAPPGARTGVIIGQVVDSDTGTPIPQAIVQLTMPKYSGNPAAPNSRVMADEHGRFFFTDLPPGDYYVSGTKEGYAGGVYGQRRPQGDSLLFTLAEGERRQDATFALWKLGVISGTVIDEAGEPVVGVRVNALSRDFLAGRARFGKMVTEAFNLPTATTDDRGMFRFSKLRPADYVVVVPSTEVSVPVAVLASFAQNTTLRGDLLQAVAPNGSSNVNSVYDTFPLGQSRAQQVGDSVLVTLNGVQIPPPPSSAGRIDVYPTTYYPAAPTAAGATVLSLAGGEEKNGVQVRLQPSPAYRVSGRLVLSSGAPPPPMAIRLIGNAAADVADDGFETAIGMSDAGGRFTLLGVPPGEYVLKNVNNIFAPAHRQGLPALWVQQRVAVGAKDVDGLTVTLRDEVRLEGRVQFHAVNGPAPGPRDAGPRDVVFEPPAGAPSMYFSPRAQYANRETFSTFGAAGQYIVRPSEAAGWVVESVTLDGKDITDKAIDISGDITTLSIVYTDKRSAVTGTIKNANGSPNANGVALAFPADPSAWSGYGANPRTLRRATRSSSAVYTFDNLPSGVYLVVAIDAAAAENWTDPKMLARLAPQATKITVTAGELKTADLTMKVIR